MLSRDLGMSESIYAHHRKSSKCIYECGIQLCQGAPFRGIPIDFVVDRKDHFQLRISRYPIPNNNLEVACSRPSISTASNHLTSNLPGYDEVGLLFL